MSLKYLSCPSKILADSITASSTSFKLNNIKGWDGVDLTSANFGSIGYGVIRNANNTVVELFEYDPATIADASITFNKRGLKFDGDLTTEVSANKLSWTKGDTYIDIGVDTPQVLQTLQTNFEAAIVVGGVPATDSVAGLIKTATPALFDAGTDSDGTYKYVPTVGLLNSRTYLVDTGVANAYVITPNPAITSYVAGQTFTFKAINANTTTSTLNVNGLGTKTIKTIEGDALISGRVKANQILTVIYDGADFVVISGLSSIPPVVNIFSTVSTKLGDSTTRFDVTNPSGTTFRYTWDATGTNPSISSSNPNIGDGVSIIDTNLAAGNRGSFVVTGSGTNYFEVSNASGAVESDKTISTGQIAVVSAANFWTKDPGLKYIVIEGVGAASGSDTDDKGGGSGGGYFKKLIAAESLGATEIPTIGPGGVGAASSVPPGGHTSFGIHSIGRGGTGNNSVGGAATGGDINIGGQSSDGGSTGTGGNYPVAGGSMLGLGGLGSGRTGTGYGSGGTDGANGRQGIIIVTEYYS